MQQAGMMFCFVWNTTEKQKKVEMAISTEKRKGKMRERENEG